MTGRRNQSSSAAQLSGWAVGVKVKHSEAEQSCKKEKHLMWFFKVSWQRPDISKYSSCILEEKENEISTSNKTEFKALANPKWSSSKKHWLHDYFFNDFKSQWNDLIFKFHFNSLNGLCQLCIGLLSDSSSAVFWEIG